MSFRVLAAALLLALPATGADAPLPELRIEPKAGGSIFFIKNVSSQPISAYLIELVGYPGSSYSLWQDDIWPDGGSGMIAPGTEQRTEIANMTVGAVPDYVKVQAAIYSDGTTAGIPEKVKQLLERRRAMLGTTRDLIRRLQSGETNLKQLAESAPKASGKSQAAINQAASNKLIEDTAARLKTHSVEDTLADLRAREKAMAASLPAL